MKSFVERPLTNVRDVGEIDGLLSASNDRCFDQLSGVGEVAVERPERQSGTLRGLLDRRKHHVLSEHFKDHVKHGVTVALPPGRAPIDRRLARIRGY